VTAWRRSTDVEDVVRVSVHDLSPPWHAWLGLARSGVKLRVRPKGARSVRVSQARGRLDVVNNRESLMMPRYLETLGRGRTPGLQGPRR
jgi:hypothetical protein